jgi:hypothetical protein
LIDFRKVLNEGEVPDIFFWLGLVSKGYLIDFCMVLNEGQEPDNFFWMGLVAKVN